MSDPVGMLSFPLAVKRERLEMFYSEQDLKTLELMSLAHLKAEESFLMEGALQEEFLAAYYVLERILMMVKVKSMN